MKSRTDALPDMQTWVRAKEKRSISDNWMFSNSLENNSTLDSCFSVVRAIRSLLQPGQ